MICAYCDNDRKATKEHVIPKGILDLFPECDYTFHTDTSGTKAYPSESVIKDVCAHCNNQLLGELDAYGLELVRKYFLQEHSTPDALVTMEYDHSLLSRWLLKIAYNSERSSSKDSNRLDWFKQTTQYMLGFDTAPSLNYSIFGGLAINTSPMPLFWANNIQLSIWPKPILVPDGMLQLVNPFENTIRRNPNITDMLIEGLAFKYLVQFGSGLFLILMWEDGVCQNTVENYEKLIEMVFPYKLLDIKKTSVVLNRCTHAFNILFPQMIDCNTGIALVDLSNAFIPPNVDPMELNRQLKRPWDTHVQEVRENKKKQLTAQKEASKLSKRKKSSAALVKE